MINLTGGEGAHRVRFWALADVEQLAGPNDRKWWEGDRLFFSGKVGKTTAALNQIAVSSLLFW
jgi:hypothetical protein